MSDEPSSPDPQNPYEDRLGAPRDEPASAAADHSVFAEPWMQKSHFEGDPHSDASGPTPQPGDVEHTVWDEPSLSPDLAGGTPEDALTWRSWYDRHAAATSLIDTWLITTLVIIVSAPLALFTAWFRFGGSAFDLLVVVLIVPATEEILKVALPLWIVEKRPYLYRAPFQILLCAVVSGLFFGAARYVFTFRLFVPGAGLAANRETLMSVVTMHTVCSAFAAFGLIRIWSRAVGNRQPPNLTDGGVWGSLAVALHVGYAAIIVATQLA